jgi:hypothetical protein
MTLIRTGQANPHCKELFVFIGRRFSYYLVGNKNHLIHKQNRTQQFLNTNKCILREKEIRGSNLEITGKNVN